MASSEAQVDAKAELARTAKSWIANNNEREGPFWYGRATIYEGYQAAYDVLKDEKLLEWYRTRIDGLVVADDGSIHNFRPEYYSLDDYRIGNCFLYWYQRTGLKKYRIAANTIRSMLDRTPRTATGGFWHRDPVYAHQMWLDGIFMATSFYARWTALFDADNVAAWRDIVLQFVNVQAACLDPDTRLLKHGYDESKKACWADAATGASPLVWNREVGWYFMALIEVLEVYPKNLDGYARLLGYYKSLAEAVRASQDPESSGWKLILSKEYANAKCNYFEASGAAMFTYGLLAGVRKGYIDSEEYLSAALRAYKALVDTFVVSNPDGTSTFKGTVEVGSLDEEVTLDKDGSFKYYVDVPTVDDDTRGIGPFMLASAEYARYQSK